MTRSWEPQADGVTDRPLRVVLTPDEKRIVREARDRATREESSLVKGVVSQRPRQTYGQCRYCGFLCTRGACPEHWDLLMMERAEATG